MNAGQAHNRFHIATAEQGLELGKNKNLNMSDADLIANYIKAYANPSLNDIEGSVRTGNSSNIVANSGTTPSDGILKVIECGMSELSKFKALMYSDDMKNKIQVDSELNKIFTKSEIGKQFLNDYNEGLKKHGEKK